MYINRVLLLLAGLLVIFYPTLEDWMFGEQGAWYRPGSDGVDEGGCANVLTTQREWPSGGLTTHTARVENPLAADVFHPNAPPSLPILTSTAIRKTKHLA